MGVEQRGLLVATMVACGLALAPASSRGQMGGMGRSLGGYGGGTIESYYRSRAGALIPYGGGFGGYIPYRSLEPRGWADGAMAARRVETTPIGGASRSMGLGAIDEGAMARGYAPFEVGGMGTSFSLGGPLIRPSRMPSAGMRRLPAFGSPFRQPPRIGGAGGASMGAM